MNRRREKVATCLDAVLIMKEILFEQAIESKIWMLFLKEKRKAHSVLTFEIDGRIVYLELTPQSGKSNYGKEILFEGIEEFVSFWEQQGYIVSDITDVCTPGANPDFFQPADPAYVFITDKIIGIQPHQIVSGSFRK